jgi:hypothetical protein
MNRWVYGWVGGWVGGLMDSQITKGMFMPVDLVNRLMKGSKYKRMD